jgi:hypothetical protein
MCSIIIMSDQFVFDSSLHDEVVDPVFIKKKWLYCNDDNNGNYDGGLIRLNTTTLSNAGMWMDYKQGVLAVPIIVTLSTVGDVINWSSIKAEYMAALKNGNHHLIHTLQVSYNNTPILAPVDFTNIHASYKLMSTMCTNDLDTIAPTIGFSPDDSNSWGYVPAGAAPTPFGHGSVNNNNLPGSFIPSKGYLANQLARGNRGLIKRQESTCVSIPGTTSALTTETLQSTSMNQVVKKTATYQSMYIMAYIRLRDIHDFFQKIPILKGSTLLFEITTNQSVFQIQNLVLIFLEL